MDFNKNFFGVESEVEQFKIIIEIKEASKLTGLCYITFYANFRKDNIPHQRYGKKILFYRKDILEYMERHKAGNWADITDVNIINDEKIGIKEACSILNLCYDTFYGIMRRKQLPRFQYGTKIVFCKSFIQEFKNSCVKQKWEKQCQKNTSRYY